MTKVRTRATDTYRESTCTRIDASPRGCRSHTHTYHTYRRTGKCVPHENIAETEKSYTSAQIMTRHAQDADTNTGTVADARHTDTRRQRLMRHGSTLADTRNAALQKRNINDAADSMSRARGART